MKRQAQKKKKTILGKLYVAGIGPGSLDGMTKEAFKAIGDCQVIAGYTVYADLVNHIFQIKSISSLL